MSVHKQEFTQPLWLDPDAIHTTMAQGQASQGEALEPKLLRFVRVCLFVCLFLFLSSSLTRDAGRARGVDTRDTRDSQASTANCLTPIHVGYQVHPYTRPRDAALRAREPSRSRDEKVTHTTFSAIPTRSHQRVSQHHRPVPRTVRLRFCHAEPYCHCFLSSAARIPAVLSSQLIQELPCRRRHHATLQLHLAIPSTDYALARDQFFRLCVAITTHFG